MGLRQEINPCLLLSYSLRLPSGLVAGKFPVPAALQQFCRQLLKPTCNQEAELLCFVRNSSLNVSCICDAPWGMSFIFPTAVLSHLLYMNCFETQMEDVALSGTLLCDLCLLQPQSVRKNNSMNTPHLS